LLPKPIAKKFAPVPDTKPGTRDSGNDKQPSLSSETMKLPTSAAVSEAVPVYVAHDRQTDESHISRLSSEKVVVRKGDTLSAIAYRHFRKNNRAVVETILSANPAITDKNRIYSGQVLVLPETQSDYRHLREPMKEEVMEFSIQVCTLIHSSRAVAEDYVSQLRKRDYPGYITEMHARDGSRMYKICIGKYQTEAEAIDAALYFQEKEGKPYIIIKSEADSAAPPDGAEPSSDFSESEGSAIFPENGEDTSQPLEDATQKSVPPDSVEQGVQ